MGLPKEKILISEAEILKNRFQDRKGFLQIPLASYTTEARPEELEVYYILDKDRTQNVAIEEEERPPLPIPGKVGRGRGERTEHELRFVCYSLASTLWATIWKVLNRAHGSPYCVCVLEGTAMANGGC